MIRRIVNPMEVMSGDFLQADLHLMVIREQEIGNGTFRCSYCGDPHLFVIRCESCDEVFPAAMVTFQQKPEIPGYILIAGFCGDCETINFLSGSCPNAEQVFPFEFDLKQVTTMEVFDAHEVTNSELKRIQLLWRESGNADVVNSEVLQLVERLTRETGSPIHIMHRPNPSQSSGVMTITVNGSLLGRVEFQPVRHWVQWEA